MATFVTEDGKGGISGDKFMQQMGGQTYTQMWFNAHNTKRHKEVTKLVRPHGDKNYKRLGNVNMYDLLSHIQGTLSLTNRCIIELITNEDHPCLKTTGTISRRIHQFAEAHMDEKYINDNPRSKVRYKITNENGEEEYKYRDETDEEWHDRLCHMYMHQYYPNKLQMIKCEECIQKWMNSDIW